ncbi:class A beta-lactamase [Microlunatus speluncae]|uniref:class A beta-lactamase n=1 Tax=Microlunatus speluncae TaxID=2594267 RepID=UPI0012664828|nr:class A beta-lactamase [Microlunatus speluncae]
MNSASGDLARRSFLGLVALVPLAGCAAGPASPDPGPGTGSSAPATTPETPVAKETPAPPGPTASAAADAGLAALEKKFDARLGVFAWDTGTGRAITHRADDRFAFCSTFKGLAAAAVVQGNPLSHLETLVRYGEDELMKSSMITKKHVKTGMTIRQLCDAAVRFSDGTAGNLLLRDLGGPRKLTEFARSLGDEVTRMDRIEPDIVSAEPGDLRDTSSPRALGGDYHQIVLGEALVPDKRAVLRDLLERNTTGAARIKAVLPKGWKIANKTGTGDYGTINDIAILWPPKSAPLVISIMSSRPDRNAAYNEDLVAEAAGHVLEILS